MSKKRARSTTLSEEELLERITTPPEEALLESVKILLKKMRTGNGPIPTSRDPEPPANGDEDLFQPVPYDADDEAGGSYRDDKADEYSTDDEADTAYHHSTTGGGAEDEYASDQELPPIITPEEDKYSAPDESKQRPPPIATPISLHSRDLKSLKRDPLKFKYQYNDLETIRESSDIEAAAKNHERYSQTTEEYSQDEEGSEEELVGLLQQFGSFEEGNQLICFETISSHAPRTDALLLEAEETSHTIPSAALRTDTPRLEAQLLMIEEASNAAPLTPMGEDLDFSDLVE